MVKMVANAYGKRKAEKFRKRFGLTIDGFHHLADQDYIDAHDYLHTETGALPVWDDEQRVLELEEAVLAGKIKLRGLKVICN